MYYHLLAHMFVEKQSPTYSKRGPRIRPLEVHKSTNFIYGQSQDLCVFAAPGFNWFYLLLS